MSVKAIINRIITKRGLRRVTRVWAYPLLTRRVKKGISRIGESTYAVGKRSFKSVTYIRSDFWLKECTPNGAVAHTEGVVDAMEELGLQVSVVSTYPMPFLKSIKDKRVCSPVGWYTGISELEEVEYNGQLYEYLNHAFPNPDFVYQRYGRNNYAGLKYARNCSVPFILEYNGSEVWMSRNWGRPLRYERLSEIIESFVLRNADLVVGNADAFRKELVGRGVNPNRILIIPNGVDPDRFSPHIAGTQVRDRLFVKNTDVLVSFVGSFGPWHGAEVLAQSIKQTVSNNQSIKFMFVGTGERLSRVKEIVADDGVEDYALFTGFVSRDDIASYLAASDILVSPQVPNPDGTPFFGSPTKLFEYMAMGKAIVASRLDQMKRILVDGEDAVLFHPGDPHCLSEAILLLACNKELRDMLGWNAREKVVNQFSWNRHVQLILDKMNSVCGDE